MSKGKNYTPNDQRSRSMNGQDAVGKSAISNHIEQMTPNTQAYDSSRSGNNSKNQK